MAEQLKNFQQQEHGNFVQKMEKVVNELGETFKTRCQDLLGEDEYLIISRLVPDLIENEVDVNFPRRRKLRTGFHSLFDILEDVKAAKIKLENKSCNFDNVDLSGNMQEYEEQIRSMYKRMLGNFEAKCQNILNAGVFLTNLAKKDQEDRDEIGEKTIMINFFYIFFSRLVLIEKLMDEIMNQIEKLNNTVDNNIGLLNKVISTVKQGLDEWMKEENIILEKCYDFNEFIEKRDLESLEIVSNIVAVINEFHNKNADIRIFQRNVHQHLKLISDNATMADSETTRNSAYNELKEESEKTKRIISELINKARPLGRDRSLLNNSDHVLI